MATPQQIAQLQACISNPLDARLIGNKYIAGVIGDSPSHYSKSPALWNAAFRRLKIDAVYLPFDVNDSRLSKLAGALRSIDAIRGFNVTVPHKSRIIQHLDEIDPAAARIQAVNTVVRTAEGKLVGYNTDGDGFIESILTPHPGETRSFVASLKGLDVLLLGAGGSARAVAFSLADRLDGGKLVVCNRTLEHARSLAAEIHKAGAQAAQVISEDELTVWAPKVSFIVNSTIKGQGGVRKLPDGSEINMEPYSALASAHPANSSESDYATAPSDRRRRNILRPDIEANNQISLSLARLIPSNVGFYDLVYFPEETVFLRHGRITGHRTMNGKGMIVYQAAIAFSQYIFKAELQSRGIGKPDTLSRITEIMYEAW